MTALHEKSEEHHSFYKSFWGGHESPKSVGFILWGPWKPVQNFITTDPVVTWIFHSGGPTYRHATSLAKNSTTIDKNATVKCLQFAPSRKQKTALVINALMHTSQYVQNCWFTKSMPK